MGQRYTGLNPAFLSASEISLIYSGLTLVVSLLIFLLLDFGVRWREGCTVTGVDWGCESIHPIFYYLLYYSNGYQMKSNSIVQVISEISNYSHLQIESHPLLTLQSITNGKTCTHCENLLVVINELNDKIVEVSVKHNKLLAYSKKLIDLNYSLFQQQQARFEETAHEFQQDMQQNQAKIKELQSVIEENGKTVWQYRNLLLEKDEIIAELEDKVEKIEQTSQSKNVGSPSHEIETLKHHRREKSQLCNKLQNQNVHIQSENSKLRQQNQRLAERIAELSEYVLRMEEDLANVNIKSPRMLKKFVDPPELSNSNVFNEISRCSIDEQSPIREDEPQPKKQDVVTEEPHRISIQSSYGPNGRVLRDVLNISGQTSKYFNFRTKQRLDQSNAYLIRDNTSQNNENDMNLTNRHQDTKNQGIKIMEIKQFEVHESVDPAKKQTKKENNKKSNKDTSPCIMIDPYYAFFVLTIQCLKMNWRSLDQVANVSLGDQWDKIITKQIPINQWGDYLKQAMASKINM